MTRLRALMLWGALLSECMWQTNPANKEAEQCLDYEAYGKPDPKTGKPAPTSDNLFQQ